MTLRAVVFDAGNTLLYLDYRRLAAEVGSACGLALTAEGLGAHAAEAARSLECSEGTDRERASVYLEALFRLGGVPAERWPDVRDCLLRLHLERHLWSWIHPETPAALRRLHSAGFRLGVVSNSDGRAEEALAAAGLRDFFDVVIDSALVDCEKPEPEIFHFALDALGVQPEETLYVGDLYEVDVVGARRVGMDVALIDPVGRHRGRDVRSAASIAELVDQLLLP